MRENVAYLALAAWLILMGITQLISGDALTIIMGILALAAGIFLLVNNVRVAPRRNRRS